MVTGGGWLSARRRWWRFVLDWGWGRMEVNGDGNGNGFCV